MGLSCRVREEDCFVQRIYNQSMWFTLFVIIFFIKGIKVNSKVLEICVKKKKKKKVIKVKFHLLTLPYYNSVKHQNQ
jgi:hypothetical protein